MSPHLPPHTHSIFFFISPSSSLLLPPPLLWEHASVCAFPNLTVVLTQPLLLPLQLLPDLQHRFRHLFPHLQYHFRLLAGPKQRQRRRRQTIVEP